MYAKNKNKNETKERQRVISADKADQEWVLHVTAGGENCNYSNNSFFLAGSQVLPGKKATCLIIILASPAPITALGTQWVLSMCL